MRGILAQDYAGYTVLIGGDLNDDPLSDTLNSFYHADYGEDAHGQLKEVDSPCGNGMYVYADILVGAYCRDGERTGGELPLPGGPGGGIRNKIDYLFVTPAVDVHDADATKSLHSDHDPLWADVTVPLANAGGSDTVMVVGDSISQGLEGDYTWRYRLDEHLRAGGVNVNFAGPYSGTTRLPAELPPGFPQVSPPPHFSGVYRDGLAFDSDHFAQWGRQAHQAMHDVQSRVAEYQPNYLLVELGFNDLGWGVSNPDGLIADIKTLIANARTANPDIRILVANVLHRTPLAIQPDLGAKISAYNEKLGPALRSVNSTASPVHLVDIDTGYDPLADAYDGLHPNVFGEYKIARAFANVLATEFGLGGQFGAIGRTPALVPERSEWIRATPEPAGITVRWQHSFGADGYWLYQRDVTAGGQFERSALQIPADSWTVNWVVPGHTYDFYVIPTRGNYQADLPLALAS